MSTGQEPNDTADPGNVNFDWGDQWIEESSFVKEGVVKIKSLGIAAVYARSIGKGEVMRGNKIRCPLPGHEDKKPSATINEVEGVWNCHKCVRGGDAIDLVAIQQGIDLDAYKGNPKLFVELLENAHGFYGMEIERGGDEPEPEVKKARKPSDPFESVEEVEDSVTKIFGGFSWETPDSDEAIAPPKEEGPPVELDWKGIVAKTAKTSVLREYMESHKDVDTAKEFQFFAALQAVGNAAGNNVIFWNRNGPVRPNLHLVMLGKSGIGKTSSYRSFQSIFRGDPAFVYNDETGEGVKVLGRPGSGERLFQDFQFTDMETDPHTGLATLKPVQGWVTISEMSDLMAAVKRQGSVLRDKLIDFIDAGDARDVTETHTTVKDRWEAKQPFLSLTMGAQPDALNSIMENNDVASGFANRLIYVQGNPVPRIPFTGEVEPLDYDETALRLAQIKKWAGSGRVVKVAEDAIEGFDKMDESLNKLKEKGDLYGRMAKHAMKLCMVVAIECREGDVKEVFITKEVVAIVKEMMEYLVPTLDLVDTKVGVSEREQLYEDIMARLQAAPSPMTRNRIHNRVKQKTLWVKKTSLIDSVLQEMVAKKAVVVTKGSGKVKEKYSLETRIKDDE